jgi:hypothetical protein
VIDESAQPAHPRTLPARERRRAAALTAAERVIAAAGPGQLETIADRLQALAIAARMARRPKEEQAARKALALAERRLADMRNNSGPVSGFAQYPDFAP